MSTQNDAPSRKVEQIRCQFKSVLEKTNKENPRPQDVKVLSDMLR